MPLNEAARRGYLSIVDELYSRGASVKSADKNGLTPLHDLLPRGDLKTVEYLISKGAEVNRTDNDGITPIYWASNYGANVNSKALDGSTELFGALWNGNVDIVKVLLDHEASGHTSDWHGLTPLHVASISSNGSANIVKLLRENGARVSAQDKNGDCALHKAAFWGHFEVVKELIDHGASVDPQNKDGHTPLHLASKKGNLKILGYLLKKDANMNAKSKDSKTPRDLGNEHVKEYFDRCERKLNIKSATEVILQAAEEFENMKTISSTVKQTVSSILRLSSNVRFQRPNVLTIGVIVEYLIRCYIRNNYKPVTVLTALEEIHEYWHTRLTTIQTWKLDLTKPNEQAKIKTTIRNLKYFQNRLYKAAKQLHASLNIQVVGSFDDVQHDIGQMIETMNNLDMHLRDIKQQTDGRKQMDGLKEMSIQLQRGLEHYERQVKLGNCQRNNEFESLVLLSQRKIDHTRQRSRETNLLAQLNFNPFGLFNRNDKWLLASSDILFDNRDKKSALGQGVSATVFRGTYHGQEVAVKEFGIVTNDSTDLEDLFKEIKSWQDLAKEPYILTLIGVCTMTPSPLIVSEVCQTNIRRYVRDWPQTLIPMVYQYACGLASLHKANIIHRDLKGDNVLITYQKTVAIGDFGLSRTITSLKKSATRAKIVGTLNWMSPEQYLSPQNVTTKSDIWSFGMTLWEIMRNDTPFRGCSEHEFSAEIFMSEHDRPIKPDDLDAKYEPLWNLINECWQLNPNLLPTANEIIDILETNYSDQLNLYKDLEPIPVIENTTDNDEYPLSSTDSFELAETDHKVSSLEELIRLILTDTTKEWPLFHNFILCPTKIESIDQNTFKARHRCQPRKQLAVQLSEKEPDVLNEDYVDRGEWHVAHFSCVATIIERSDNCDSVELPTLFHFTALPAVQIVDHLPPCVWMLDGFSEPLLKDTVKDVHTCEGPADLVDKDGWTAQISASAKGNMEELLAQGAPIAATTKDGWTSLNSASRRGHLNIVRELLAHGVSVEAADKVNLASFKGHLEVVKELLAHGALIDAANKDGWTPLYSASYYGHLEVVKELLAHGALIDAADNVMICGIWSVFPSLGLEWLDSTELASSEGHLDVVKELLAHGASI
ncbi:hypothetical protein AeMF1_018064 [Aphanomyces euteiches]|nr:hypothetical protein AeMF1_018064 [Aphanomyces euteiches]KAH9185196.1 hypothetical protein AeNC1_012829 [Aphanomyces euteiches]